MIFPGKGFAMEVSVKKKSACLLVALIFIARASMANAADEVTFSGGAPLDGYQPRIIIPILKEAFKRNGIRFHANYHPSLRSLVMTNSGKMTIANRDEGPLIVNRKIVNKH